MDKTRKPGKPSLSDADRWKNICDALAEDVVNDESPPFTDPAIVNRIRAHLASVLRAEGLEVPPEPKKARQPAGEPKQRQPSQENSLPSEKDP